MKAFFTLLFLLPTLVTFGQRTSDQTLTEFGQAYRRYMSEAAPQGFAQKQLVGVPDSLQPAANFIAQTITENNALLKKEYLTVPDAATLRNIYYIFGVGRAEDNAAALQHLRKAAIPRAVLVDTYYTALFIAVGNKNRPFDLSRYNLVLGDYDLQDETEKGIFFLRCMELCEKMVRGYVYMATPASRKQALLLMAKYPKINGLPYFQYTALDFPDFPLNISGERGPQSYKFFCLNKYYDLLLAHFACLSQEKASQRDRAALVSTSIIKDRSLHKYTANAAKLERILQEYKL